MRWTFAVSGSVAVALTTFGAVSASADPEPARKAPERTVSGRVAASPDVFVRDAPDGAKIGSARLNTRFTVLCYARGAYTISGWGGANPYWNKVADSSGRVAGYIADVWLDTAGDITGQVPECSRRASAPVDPEADPEAAPGHACVFLDGDTKRGKVAWAYRMPGGDYFYGSTEGGTAPPGGNRFWSGTADDFRELGGELEGRGFDEYKCADTPGSAFTKAHHIAQDVSHRPYDHSTNNSAHQANRILSAYTASGSSSPATIPKHWFQGLDAPFWH
ncbi:hypothetical protein [Actinocorallia libanotica]|uniref:SH3 domain-containing protein n=1 Tax=Actinocorallia libanotica TaxID=46162 RepID=A0ABN1QRS5_9ACTN